MLTFVLLQMIQIAKILNAHMDSLQWIDQHTGESDVQIMCCINKFCEQEIHNFSILLHFIFVL